MKRLKAPALFALAAAVTAPIAYVTMFSGFRLYDDEGYFLLTLKDYVSGHSLLSSYAPLYGPFFYEVTGGLFKVLGVAPGHDSGRVMSIIVWLLASLIGGLASFHLTRNIWLGLAAQLVTFSVLTALTDEPSSTYGLSSLLLLSMVWAASFRSRWPRATAALIGAMVAALFLIKINIGAFAALAVGFAWACSLPQRRRLIGVVILGILLVIAPPAVMKAFLDRDWALEFALLVSLSAAAVGLAGAMSAQPHAPPRSLRWLLFGGVLVAACSLGVAIAGGTSLKDLWNALTVSLRFPGVFVVPLTTGPIYDIWAAVCALAAVVILHFKRVGIPVTAIAFMRFGAGLFAMLLVLTLPESIWLLALPLVWLAAHPPLTTSADRTDGYARLLLPALVVMESLQAYPVAGTQLSLAALALVPVGAVTLNDGLRELQFLSKDRSMRFRPVSWVAPAVVLMNVAVLTFSGVVDVSRFVGETPLGLRGAESVRLPAQQAAQLQGLVGAIDRECSSFLTYPGMDSFYLWSTQAPPTPMRYGQWWLLLDKGQQSSLVDDLSRRPRLCVVKSQPILNYWLEGRRPLAAPLIDFIDQGFVESASFGACDLFVRR